MFFQNSPSRNILTKIIHVGFYFKVSAQEGSRLDIRLPSVSPGLRTRRDIRKAVVGVPNPSTDEVPDEAATTAAMVGTVIGDATVDEDSDDYDGEYGSVAAVYLLTVLFVCFKQSFP